jgi:hypothetical protein
MQSFTQPVDLKPDPFFITRVMNALEQRQSDADDFSGYGPLERLLRPAFVTVVIAVNLLSAGFALNRAMNSSDATAMKANLAAEYGFLTTQYDILQTPKTEQK